MLTKIVAVVTSLIMLLGSITLIAEKRITRAPSQQALLETESVIQKKELGDDVYVVDLGSYTYEEKLTAIALQGIVAKTNPCIYLIQNGADKDYLAAIKESGKKLHYEYWKLDELITEFEEYIGDSGYILYRESELGEGLNVATNYATAYGWLPVQANTAKIAKRCGLTLKMDISGDDYDYSFQQKHRKALDGYFRKGVVVHEKYKMVGLRDLAIEQSIYCFYTDSTDEGNTYLKKVLSASGKNTAILGWTEMEKDFVTRISKQGCYIVPADICSNNSYLACFETEVTQPVNTAEAYNDPTKHYITLVWSDGDNCQWIQNDFSVYHKMMNEYPDTPITWTVSPFLSELNPLALNRTYDHSNENQCFVSGPSGIGYSNLASYDASSVDLMSTRTAAAMLKSNQRIVTLIDNYSMIKERRFAYRLGYFSRFDNIDGGILFLDSSKYMAGGGKVWFSGDKPFASVRLSLWADGDYDSVTDEWIEEQADIVNNYPVDINSVNGYSVICVHAWSMSIESVQKFISALDEHVEILNADDFLKTIQQNVPHTDATPTAS